MLSTIWFFTQTRCACAKCSATSPITRCATARARLCSARAEHNLALAVAQRVIGEVAEHLAQAQRVCVKNQIVDSIHADGPATRLGAVCEALPRVTSWRARVSASQTAP